MIFGAYFMTYSLRKGKSCNYFFSHIDIILADYDNWLVWP